jgi:hypothetical protein
MREPCEVQAEWSVTDFMVKRITPQYLALEQDFPSFVYVIQSGEDGPVKIGSAARPSKRIVNLQTSCWQDLFLRAVVPAIGNVDIEQAAHVLAREHAIRGEWFDLTPAEATWFVLEAMRVQGVEPKPLKVVVDGFTVRKPWRSKGGPPDYVAARQAEKRRKLGID